MRRRYFALLLPTMFQQVVEYLERKPAPRGGNFRRDEESRAAVAVCLRWGSEKAIIRQAQDGLYTGLKAVDMLKYGGAWPPSAEQVAAVDFVCGPTVGVQVQRQVRWWSERTSRFLVSETHFML